MPLSVDWICHRQLGDQGRWQIGHRRKGGGKQPIVVGLLIRPVCDQRTLHHRTMAAEQIVPYPALPWAGLIDLRSERAARSNRACLKIGHNERQYIFRGVVNDFMDESYKRPSFFCRAAKMNYL